MHLRAPRLPQKRQPKHILPHTNKNAYSFSQANQNTCSLSHPYSFQVTFAHQIPYTLAMAFPRESRLQNCRKLTRSL